MNDLIESKTDELVNLLVQEMKTVISELLPIPNNKHEMVRGIVLASITWTLLGQKILKKLDDVRHEHLLAMKQLTDAKQ